MSGIICCACSISSQFSSTVCSGRHDLNKIQEENESQQIVLDFSVKSTSPVTENHNKNGHVNNKNFIMTNEDNSDTKYTIHNDTNDHDARELHK